MGFKMNMTWFDAKRALQTWGLNQEKDMILVDYLKKTNHRNSTDYPLQSSSFLSSMLFIRLRREDEQMNKWTIFK